MKVLDWLERRAKFLAVPNVTWAITVATLFVYFMSYAREDLPAQLVLFPRLVMQGEWWRVFTFVIAVGQGNVFWFLLGLLGFWFIGTAMERTWGPLRFNMFLLVGWAATVAASFITPDVMVTPLFLVLSVFLAFATLHPDFMIYVMLILPVKAKWLAMAAWVIQGYLFITGGMATRVQIAAALLNYFVFFGAFLVRRMRGGAKLMGRQVAARKGREPFHRCTVCGKTDVSNPEMDFRYCPQCTGGQGYCPEHINKHEHV